MVCNLNCHLIDSEAIHGYKDAYHAVAWPNWLAEYRHFDDLLKIIMKLTGNTSLFYIENYAGLSKLWISLKRYIIEFMLQYYYKYYITLSQNFL